MKMNEDFLQYIWRTRLFNFANLTTTEEIKIEIIDFGMYNKNAGPDFLHAKIKMQEIIWTGHIEIHVKSSDWYKHKHSEDPAYKNIILHVVYDMDIHIILNNRTLPCLELKSRIPKIYFNNYKKLNSSILKWTPCQDFLVSIPTVLQQSWLDRLGMERLIFKAQETSKLLHHLNQDWETCFYILLSKYMGGTVNGHAFQRLAESVPLSLIRKNSHRPDYMLALFLGQSGLLSEHYLPDYHSTLESLYQFLRIKYNLTPMQKLEWKWSRMRPKSFPQHRIIQLISIRGLGNSLFTELMEKLEENNPKNSLFSLNPEFDKLLQNSESKNYISSDLSQHLMINAFIPLYILFIEYYRPYNSKEKLITILENMYPEKNNITIGWNKYGIKASHAFHSQGMIQLKKAYCEPKNCLKCAFGHTIIQGVK